MERVVTLFGQLKDQMGRDSLPQAKATLTQLKIELAKSNFLLPEQTDNPRFIVTRDILEHAVLLSLKERDSEGFERHMAQLKNYYNDPRKVEESPIKWKILGINLLRLLAYNRVAEFHTELELIPIASHSNVYIKHSIALEQFLMEGSYSKIFDARNNVPAPEYVYFMDILMSTVRSEIASCAEKAYSHLSVQEAQKLFRLNSKEETVALANQRQWKVVGDRFEFAADGKKDEKKQAVPAYQLII